MEYLKINYYKLENIRPKNFFIFIILTVVSLNVLLFTSCFIDISNKLEFVGVYNSDVITIKINTNLSDKLKKGNYIEFNGYKTNYKIKNFQNAEFINNELYQEVELITDKKFKTNEAGIVSCYYSHKKLIKYIFELFK